MQSHPQWPRGRYHGGRRPSSDDSFHSPTVIPLSALDKPSIMKRCHRRRTCSHTSPRRSPTMVTFHDTRFVERRWWNVKTVVTGRSSASMIPAPGDRDSSRHVTVRGRKLASGNGHGDLGVKDVVCEHGCWVTPCSGVPSMYSVGPKVSSRLGGRGGEGGRVTQVTFMISGRNFMILCVE